MDPDACLRALRRALTDYRAAEHGAADGARRGDSRAVELDNLSMADAAAVLAEQAESLDGWLSRGGFLPAAWRRS